MNAIRPGQEYEMTIEGIGVHVATVEDVDGDEVTISWPAGRVIMGMKSALQAHEVAPTVDREAAYYDETPDGGSKAREDVDRDGLTFVRQPASGIPQEYIGDVSLKDRGDLDSSALD